MTTIDSFERSSLQYYSGGTSPFSIDSSRSTDGSNSLYAAPTTTWDQIYSAEGDGLNYYPQAGDTLQWEQYSTGGSDDIYFGLQGSLGETYAIEFSSSGIWMYYNSGGSTVGLHWEDLGSNHVNTWTYHTLDWQYDSGANEVTLHYIVELDDGTEIANITATDTDFVSTSGGVGFGANSGEQEIWWDNYRIESDTGAIYNLSAGLTGAGSGSGTDSLKHGLSAPLRDGYGGGGYSAGGYGEGIGDRTLLGAGYTSANTTVEEVGARELSGTASGSGETTGALARDRPLSGTSTATGTATGSLLAATEVALRGAAAGTSSLSGVPEWGSLIDGSVSGDSAAAASVTPARGVTGTATGTTSLTGELGVYTDVSVPQGVIDNFESSDLGYYTRDVDSFALETSTDRVIEGSQSLRLGDVVDTSRRIIWASTDTASLYYPHAGDTIEWSAYYEEGADDWLRGYIHFGGPDHTTCYGISIEKYGVWVHYRDPNVENGYNDLAWFTIPGDHVNTWTDHALDWQYDDANDQVVFQYTITDRSDGTVILDETITDTEFVSTSGEIGWAYASDNGLAANGGVWFDNARVEGAGVIEYTTASVEGEGEATGMGSVAYGASSTATGTGTTPPALAVDSPVSATVTGSATATGDASKTHAASGTAAGTADADAPLDRTVTLRASAEGSGDVFGVATGPHLTLLRSTTTGTGTTTALPSRAAVPTGTASGTGTTTADPIRARLVSPSAAGTGTVSAHPRRGRILTGTPQGTAALTGTVGFNYGVSADLIGRASTAPTDLSWGPGDIYRLHTLTGTATDVWPVTVTDPLQYDVEGVARLSTDPCVGAGDLSYETLDALAQALFREVDVAVPVGGYLVALSASTGGADGTGEASGSLTAEPPSDAGFGHR